MSYFFEKLQGLKIGWGIMNYAKVSIEYLLAILVLYCAF
ncbi:hypothetical protein CRYPD_1157 [uncultured Candidatus Thioglobus sp.]|nr:hypothetical protein CRYPD_1157 [uncultured Candidatus Thioglobus sp.]